jgi:hypothetical protein
MAALCPNMVFSTQIPHSPQFFTQVGDIVLTLALEFSFPMFEG